MTRKATKRKVWYVKGSGLELAISGATVTSKTDLDKLRILELSAIEAFAKGYATRTEFAQIADMNNLAETFVTMGIGPEAKSACDALQSALVEIHGRFKTTGKLGVTASNLNAMRESYLFHDAQRCAVDRSTYERAILTCCRRIHGSNSSKVVLS
jgi:hypothetical protein